ncbi:MAG: hypothetical protein AXW17_00625 [Colwellia sp. Phe_37]|nr:MAG: hypothetical protein AXW17_00625 [Colwellia sp. Phe_37]
MKMQSLYSTIKPYVAMGVIALTVTSLNVNAIGHKSDVNNPNVQYQKSEERGKHHNKMKKQFHRLVKKLDLNSTQKTKIKAIFADMKTKHQEHKETRAGFKKQVDSLMLASYFDENSFAAIYAEYQPSFQEMAMQKAKTHHQIMQVLTPEQQKKFAKMQQHKRSR